MQFDLDDGMAIYYPIQIRSRSFIDKIDAYAILMIHLAKKKQQ